MTEMPHVVLLSLSVLTDDSETVMYAVSAFTNVAASFALEGISCQLQVQRPPLYGEGEGADEEAEEGKEEEQ